MELWWTLRARLSAGGAKRSGLAAATDLNVANAACDALVTVALASTLFFAVPTGQARGRVALYLLTTMAPFALVAPVVGPLLDRVGRFRRVSLAATLIARAVLALMMAGHTGGLTLYPLALGLLICSKAFGVARSAVVPRVVPPEGNLVAVNSRLQIASTVGSVLIAPIAVGVAHLAGSAVLLRLGAVLYLGTTFLLLRLPRHVDAPRPQADRPIEIPVAFGRRRMMGNLPYAMRRVLSVRALVGFLTLFLAFWLRQGGHSTAALGALAGAVAGGNLIGLVLGRASRNHSPEGIIAISEIVAAAACVVAAFLFSLTTALVLAGFAQLAAVMAKLCLDAVMQRDVPENRRASAFGVSETAYQLAWVAGGALGLVPFTGRQGFVVAAVGMVAILLLTLRRAPRRTDAERPVLARRG